MVVRFAELRLDQWGMKHGVKVQEYKNSSSLQPIACLVLVVYVVRYFRTAIYNFHFVLICLSKHRGGMRNGAYAYRTAATRGFATSARHRRYDKSKPTKPEGESKGSEDRESAVVLTVWRPLDGIWCGGTEPTLVLADVGVKGLAIAEGRLRSEGRVTGQ